MSASDKKLLESIRNRIITFEKECARFPTRNNHILDSPVIPNLLKTTLNDYKSVYPMCHGSVLLLGHQFLEFKRKYGSKEEKQLYNDEFTINC